MTDPERRRARFIVENLRPEPVEGCPGISIYTAQPESRLSRLESVVPPYWAWPWPGGMALARYVTDQPSLVVGRRVLDLGAGSGLVGIAAAKAGAATVSAAETDRHAREAVKVNAALNGVSVALIDGDILDSEAPDFDVILAGDVFYDADLARRAIGFLTRASHRGQSVYLGDIGRPSLDMAGLVRIAEYPVRDVGDSNVTPPRQGGVFTLGAKLQP